MCRCNESCKVQLQQTLQNAKNLATCSKSCSVWLQRILQNAASPTTLNQSRQCPAVTNPAVFNCNKCCKLQRVLQYSTVTNASKPAVCNSNKSCSVQLWQIPPYAIATNPTKCHQCWNILLYSTATKTRSIFLINIFAWGLPNICILPRSSKYVPVGAKQSHDSCKNQFGAGGSAGSQAGCSLHRSCQCRGHGRGRIHPQGPAEVL